MLMLARDTVVQNVFSMHDICKISNNSDLTLTLFLYDSVYMACDERVKGLAGSESRK